MARDYSNRCACTRLTRGVCHGNIIQEMTMRIRIVLTMFLTALCVGGAKAQTTSLAGDWTGESICVGEVGACHDEQVVYHISVDPSDATKVKIGADKIVD